MNDFTGQLQTAFTHSSLMASATIAQQYTAQCTSITAANAANVQVLTNNIIRLAADAGNIMSVVMAADTDTDIAVNTKKAHALINKAAYTSELISQLAMECSMLAAAINITDLVQQLNTTDTDKNAAAAIQADSIAALTKAQEVAGKTTVITQQIKILVFQFIAACNAAPLLQQLILKKRVLNPLIAAELLQLAGTYSADAAHTAGLLPVTIQSALAAEAAALQTATICGWMNDACM